MSRYKCCSSCDSNARGKDTPPGDLDFPEVAKHVKKGGKARKREKSDHKHIYIWVDKHPAYWWAERDYYTFWNGRKFIYEYKICCEWTCQKMTKSRIKYLD